MENKFIFLEVGKEAKVVEFDTNEVGLTEKGADEVREAIGGYMEIFPLGSCKGKMIIAIFDEEGRLKDKELNVVFTNGVDICGDIVICTQKHSVVDGEPVTEFIGFDEADIEDVKKMLKLITLERFIIQ